MGKWDGKERRREPTDRLILEVPKGGNFDEVLRLIAVGLKGGSNAEVLTAINNLSRKVDIGKLFGPASPTESMKRVRVIGG